MHSTGRGPGAARFAPDLALIGVALAWGISFTVVKDTLASVPPHTLVALRFALASLALAALAPGALRASAAAWRAGLALGAVLWVGFALQTQGLVYTTPAKSAFLTGCSVLLVPLLERGLLGSAVPRATAGAVVVAVGGLALLLRPTDLAAWNRGDLLTLGCALAFALHITWLGRAAGRHPVRVLAVAQLLAVAGLGAGAALAWEVPRLGLDGRTALAVLFLGLVCSALAFTLQTWAQQRTPPSRTGLLLALEPVFAAAVAVAVWGERFTPLEAAGGGLVVGAVLFAGVEPGARGRKRAVTRLSWPPGDPP